MIRPTTALNDTHTSRSVPAFSGLAWHGTAEEYNGLFRQVALNGRLWAQPVQGVTVLVCVATVQHMVATMAPAVYTNHMISYAGLSFGGAATLV